ncbi:MAG: sulfide/dihydroorotate dehydrogenase-like FAD/NAD-binding protein [Candidatus Lokiarchaeota archaeon]|nr:sulfide/dihydroorotate dehydrogenase-like FAD/NAD-binding protein [Candidatus Lokiarchaeota archaeon]
MAKIIRKAQLNDVIYEIEVQAPEIARKGKAGQFVIVRLHEKGERIPLTLADMDATKGTIVIVFQVVGKTTLELSKKFNAGDDIRDIVGPLGQAAEVENFGTVVLLGGGCGVAPVYPQAKALKAAGNTVISIIGFRNKDLIFWKDKMVDASTELIVVTDDGSNGKKGYTTTALQEIIDSGRKIDRVISIGPLVMMANTVKVTKPTGIKTIVSLNTLMVDGTGMCGCCRVSTSKGTKFACVDGPDMDGFDLDFDEIMARNRKFEPEERVALEKYKHECQCENAMKAVEKCK